MPMEPAWAAVSARGAPRAREALASCRPAPSVIKVTASVSCVSRCKGEHSWQPEPLLEELPAEESGKDRLQRAPLLQGSQPRLSIS